MIINYLYIYALNTHSIKISNTKNAAKISAGSLSSAEQCVKDSS